MTSMVNDAVLDDVAALEAADPGGMLRAVATGGAQVRESLRLSEEAGVRDLAADGRPRAVLVTGVGGSGIAGDVLAAVAGVTCSTPISTLRGFVLPGWVGPLDLVIAVSCSGRTEETLAVAEEAARRGCRLLTVGSPRSPLARLAEQARALHVPVLDGGRPPRANVWALSVPLLAAANSLGLVTIAPSDFTAAADRLDALSEQCGPASETAQNPSKVLALELSGRLPVVWASGDVADVAAYRFACQLAENAKMAAMWGALPEAGHNAVVILDGPHAGGSGDDDEFFRDRVEDPEGLTRIRVVLLRDSVEHPRVAARRKAIRAVAEARGVEVRELAAAGESALERLASLVALGDFASTYLALGSGMDPTPIGPIDELKERIAL